ncbi:putative LPS assembly protein LptD [Blattabacterium cuenoti]|uniref:putative LPS assembly protein LptD n=1 Tax=Blattabacterium cuenoti TaxID=1653831 RepID=UPI001EEA4CB1|nr:putative LPS assembly protein LptD [Blattabacterium cuenoti]
MQKIRIFFYIILLISYTSTSIFYGNEKKENDKKNDLSFLKDIIKYRSNIQEHDIKEGKSYLEGQASIEYKNSKIEADYIEFNWKNGDLYAKSNEKSVFLRTENREFFFSKIHFNLNNEIGEAKDLYVKEKNHIIIAHDIIKRKNDFLMKKITYISDPFFLKKKDDFPDFYLKTNYLKYSFLKKSIFSGPILFYWYGVPMPIFLPFLYIPSKSKQPSYGIIYPKFGIQNKRIYMEDFGLFFPISNFLNFSITTSIYNIEKWKIQTSIKYKFKHVDHGLINYNFYNQKEKDFLFQWEHNSDFKSDSEINFHANVNYDNLFHKDAIFSYINIRKKFSNYLWFIDFYMIQNHEKKEIQFIIPEFILHTYNILLNKKYFVNRINFENRFDFQNLTNFCKTKDFYPKLNHDMSVTAYFPFFDPYLRISSKILYEDFYMWNFPYFDFSSFQKINLSTNVVSIPFHKIWKIKNTMLLKHQIKPILFFHMIYYPPIFYNVKNHFEKRINFILNNDWIIKNSWNHYKKVEILKEINTSFMINDSLIKWENFHIMGNIDLIKNFKAKYKSGINFEKNKTTYFDFYLSSKHEINLIPVKDKFQKKGKNRYDYFFFDQKNYAKYPIPINLKIDFHLNYKKNLFKKQQLFNTFLNLNGSVNITKYWKINFNTDYDVLKNKIILANIIFNRDLRSFEMSLNWIKNRSWSFFIGLKDPNFRNIIQYNEKN